MVEKDVCCRLVMDTQPLQMDIYKKTTVMACAGDDKEAGVLGSIVNTTTTLNATVRKLVNPVKQPVFVYEAGPNGYVLGVHQFCANGVVSTLTQTRPASVGR